MKKTEKERLKKRRGLDVGVNVVGPFDQELVLRRMQALVDGESSDELGVYCCGDFSVEDVVGMWEERYGVEMQSEFREGVEDAVSCGGEFSVSRTSIMFAGESFGDWDSD